MNSMTNDNGPEFARIISRQHAILMERFGSVFRIKPTNPHASSSLIIWSGSICPRNATCNSFNLKNSDRFVKHVTTDPAKKLGYLTPKEVFFGESIIENLTDDP